GGSERDAADTHTHTHTERKWAPVEHTVTTMSRVSRGAAMPSPMMTGTNPRSLSSPPNGDRDACGSGGFSGDAGADSIATGLKSCCVSDDEGARSSSRTAATTPARKTPTRSLSFSVGFTPGKQQNPTRMSISPAVPGGTNTPRRFMPVTPVRMPSFTSRSGSGRKKGQTPGTAADPMSVCKGGAGSSTKTNGPGNKNASAGTPSQAEGKENASSIRGRSHLFSVPSPTTPKAFDLMPPPLPRTPGGGGKAGLSRSSVVSPLGRHDPNLRQPSASPGRTAERPLLSPAASPRSRTFSVGRTTGGATGKAGSCARSTSTSRIGGKGTGVETSGRAELPGTGEIGSGRRAETKHQVKRSVTSSKTAAAGPAPMRPFVSHSSSSHRQASLYSPWELGRKEVPQQRSPRNQQEPCVLGGHRGGNGLHELLVGRAREFAEQGRAEALVGMPRQAAKSFSSALKIVAPRMAAVAGVPIASAGGWAAVKVELLVARAQVLSVLGKHEACAQDCRSALQLDPTLLQGVMLLGHACLRLGLHADAIRFLNEGLSMAISQPDRSVMVEAQRVCSAGIEEASRVGSALESGARSCCHGQHEAALAAASRALEIAPQCAEAQEMRASALLGLLRPTECVLFCQAGCIRPRADPEDDSDLPAQGHPALQTSVCPVQAALGMAPGVARLYASALRGCGRQQEAMPVAKQALRCRDPSLAWCLEDCARWEQAERRTREGERMACGGDYGKAVELFTQVLEIDRGCVVPNAEAFCRRGLSRLGQGKALEALDDCYRALSLLSLEGGAEGSEQQPTPVAAAGAGLAGKAFAAARGMALLVRGRAYLALSRLGEAISDLRGCVKCNPGLEGEALECLQQAEQRQAEAGQQRRNRERQERERQAAATAAAEAQAKAKAESRAAAERLRRQQQAAKEKERANARAREA
ncbi:unnamed protein product, partial [Scytosiphon promiscuus]